jgi:hypothetical protein
VDVARNGVVARLGPTGLTGRPLEPAEQLRASLATMSCAAGAFVLLGAALWSQLTIGWQWSAPAAGATVVGEVAMSCAAVALAVMALLAAGPVLGAALRQVVRQRSPRLARSLLLACGGAVVLIVGSHHFANGWPGTRGHPWAHQGLVPGGLAAFTWASTLSVSSYWAHPGALSSFPRTELWWMALSPVAFVGLLCGTARTVRQVDLSPGVLRFEAQLGGLAAGAMLTFLAGATCWVVDGGPGPRNLFHAGAIDVVGLVVMAAAVALAGRALDRARRGGLDRGVA